MRCDIWSVPAACDRKQERAIASEVFAFIERILDFIGGQFRTDTHNNLSRVLHFFLDQLICFHTHREQRSTPRSSWCSVCLPQRAQLAFVSHGNSLSTSRHSAASLNASAASSAASRTAVFSLLCPIYPACSIWNAVAVGAFIVPPGFHRQTSLTLGCRSRY